MSLVIMDNTIVKEGDIFYSSWGYEQTNIDFYKVKRLVGKKMIEIVFVESQIVPEKSSEYSDAVKPYPSKEGKKMLRRKLRLVSKDPSVRINSFQMAYLWDGKPLLETNARYGY